MEIEEREIAGVFEITLEPLEDNRGFFMRTYDRRIFGDYGIDRPWLQENHSLSNRMHILRGLHFQFPPFTEAKLIRVIRGTIFDVYVDLRKDSETFCRWGAVELTEECHKMLFIPRGFAHGFYTLSDVCEVLYKVDNVYNPKYEGGLIWNDPHLKVRWPGNRPYLSEKDAGLPSLASLLEKYPGF
jgi:dTDP-4-dehydrorhamnose 3,5-epimerase